MVTANRLPVTIAVGIGGVGRRPSAAGRPLGVAGPPGGGGVEAKGRPAAVLGSMPMPATELTERLRSPMAPPPAR